MQVDLERFYFIESMHILGALDAGPPTGSVVLIGEDLQFTEEHMERYTMCDSYPDPGKILSHRQNRLIT